MKKLLLSLLCVVFVSAFAFSAETTYTGTVTSSHKLGASVKTVTLDNVSWNIDAEWYASSFSQRDGGTTNRFTFGSAANPLKSLNFNTTYFKGKAISEVRVFTRQQGEKAKTSVHVQVGTVKSETYDLSDITTGDPVEKIFTFATPVVADKIEIIWENSNSSTGKTDKNGGCTFSKIIVKYSDEPVGPTAPAAIAVTAGSETFANGGNYEIEEGTEVSIASAGATSIEIADNGNLPIVSSGETTTWIPEAGSHDVTVTSKNEVGSTDISFTLTVNKKAEPKQPSQLAWSATQWSVIENSEDLSGAPVLSNPLKLEVIYNSSDENVAVIIDGELIIGSAGTTTITAAPADSETYEGTASYTLTITPEPVLGDITVNGVKIDGEEISCIVGDSFTFAAENAEMIGYSVENASGVVVSSDDVIGSSCTWTANNEGEYIVSITALLGSSTKTAVYQATVTPKPSAPIITDWTLVTSKEQFNAEYEYVITCTGTYKYLQETYNFSMAMAQSQITTGSYDMLSVVTGDDFKIVDDKISVLGSDAAIFTLEPTSEADKYYFKSTVTDTDGNYKYLYCSANKKSTLSADNKTAFTLTVDSKGNTTMVTKYTSSENGYMAGNPNSGNNQRFATYKDAPSATSGNRLPIQIFHKTKEIEAPRVFIDEVEVTDFETAVNLDGDKKTVRIQAADESHHIFYKHVPSSAGAARFNETANEDGFTHVEGNSAEVTVDTNGELHIYAQHPDNGLKSRSVVLTFTGDSTGIDEIGVEGEKAGAWFDLQGRRVAAPAKGGVYIRRQGSKVVKTAF